MLSDTQTLDREAIARRIPHQGTMCLLDAVLAWNEEAIRCESNSHRAPDHPLRAHGRLGAACGIEYAAQAMAVHGALVAQGSSPPRSGYLAGVRAVTLHVDRLDTIAAPLSIEAQRVTGDANTVLYSFSVHAAGKPLLTGRAMVVLDAQALATRTDS